jgi:hypothetical protein
MSRKFTKLEVHPALFARNFSKVRLCYCRSPYSNVSAALELWYLQASDTIPFINNPNFPTYKMAPADSARIQEAQRLVKIDPRKAESQFKEIISKPPAVTSDAAVREYETALVSLGELYRDEK